MIGGERGWDSVGSGRGGKTATSEIDVLVAMAEAAMALLLLMRENDRGWRC